MTENTAPEAEAPQAEEVAAEAAPAEEASAEVASVETASAEAAPPAKSGNKGGRPGKDDKPRRKRIEIPLETKLETGIAAATEAMRLLGIEVTYLEGEIDGEQVVIRIGEISEPEGGALEGRAWESLQFILNKAINRHAMRRTRLRIETEGFTGRRGDRLGKVAQTLARKVVRLRRPITIGPLANNDLRQFTTQLQRAGGVGVQTVGNDEAKRLVISPGQGRKRRRR